MSDSVSIDAREALGKLKNMLSESAETLVPWFYVNMPEYYFRTHNEDEQLKHLHAILSGQVRSERQAVQLRSPCGTRVTHISPGGDMKALAGVLEQYRDQAIQAARIYSSRDNTLRLDTLLLGEQKQCAVDGRDYKNALAALRETKLLIPEEQDEFGNFLAGTTEDYVEKFEAARAVRHFETCKCVEGTERVHVNLEKDVHPGFDRISMAMANPPSKALLLLAVKILAREEVPVDRAYGDLFDRDEGETVSVFSFYLDRKQVDLDPDSERWQRLERQLKAIKWFAFHGLEALAEEEGWEIGKVMLMQAAAEFAHQFLTSKDIYAYSSSRIVHTMLDHRDILEMLFSYFEARFDPNVGGGRDALVEHRRTEVRAAIKTVSDDVCRNILIYIYRFFRYTLRTNYYMPDRFGLAFRMDPLILAPLPKEERPFGFYCFHGPYCFGFHVRYRDMSRGGVRVVRTWSQEHFELESNRLFDEVTKLASAQQFKNKDIPEGGSKAVLLLGPEGEVDVAIKSMVDSLLDLIVVPEDAGPGKWTHPAVVDYLDREEIIYLGPDENITPTHVQWFVDRARRRGYKWPAAFMSSKPKAGIGHKQYGVTSEGVIVFADELLKSMGIDPVNEPFTVKLTGGPAGDVASNVMKFLMREYGGNARILAMSDGHGAAFDPEGLDHEELIRLVEGNYKASHFDPEKLSGPDAFAVSTDDVEGRTIRDNLHNEVVADLFIPCGGRPDTINMQNWQRFLKRDGKPSARGIVEGANIFISADARTKLEESGVLVVPGPSANKTGVICSSYEILAGLVLSEGEFIDLKDRYVDQVVKILRKRARDEARLLMREYKSCGGKRTVTELAYELSQHINQLADLVVEMLSENGVSVAGNPIMKELVYDYCPDSLVQNYGERIFERVPKAHLHALLGAYISARIMYQEGLNWAERLADVAGVKNLIMAYLQQEQVVAEWVREVRESGLGHSGDIADVLEASGRKYLTLRSLGYA
ncbi:NAD-glutamate dehydrogenase domain-containing protein [Salidesulfovibrio brasiliensis]|uniref:NAD-glutamate dehydrogenase domain-containing protein n=1 Tax=Salidesulfovibrio brasiliensis TaxID=221711 RepID=UPI0006D0B0D7|nr:NAD-glutamate dehydrogenase domain-containing protein [Salidesulfovibrio brasiliensis]